MKHIPLLFVLLSCAFILIFSAKAIWLKKTVYGDGIYYYSWMRSVIVDHDINFSNEYTVLGGTQPYTPFGMTGNVYPVGPALFWSPFYFQLHSFIRGDGNSFVYQYFTGFISCLYTLAGIIFLYRLLRKFYSDEVSFFTSAGIGWTTNLLFYGSFDTVNSHSVSFFISVILLTFILEKRSFFLIGIFTGLLGLMRTQDCIFIVSALPLIITNKKNIIVKSLQTITGFIIVFIPQLTAWQLLYGTMTRSPYLDAYHYFNFFQPHLLDVLLSNNNGLFLWTPIIAVCITGWVYKSPLSTFQRITFALLFIIQWFLIASWSFWWQGASFSGRMFVSILPLCAFGLAQILSRMYGQTRKIFIISAGILNICVIIFYLLTH